jgi:hypothetical protein
MQYKTSRQEVTGLVVNKRISVPSEYRHTVRAMVHRLLATGSFEAYVARKRVSGVAIEKANGTMNQLHGMLGFIDSIDLYNENDLLLQKAPARGLGRKTLYRQFLIYKDFYATQAPVVLCEGETDNIYLTHAIRSLAADFPNLAAVDPEGNVKLRVRIYKYPRSSTGRITGLRNGGSSLLASFIGKYKADTDRIKAPGQQNAVLVVFDNDLGSKHILKTIKQVSGSAPSKRAPFIRVIRNLYAVPTPLIGNMSESKIEDFFSSATKSIRIDGKTFNAANDINTDHQYGKRVFAEQVVRKRAGFLDFTAFRPLLSNLASAIDYHATAALGAAVPETAGLSGVVASSVTEENDATSASISDPVGNWALRRNL